MIRLLLVDDEPMIREILRDYLSADPSIEVVGEAITARSQCVKQRLYTRMSC